MSEQYQRVEPTPFDAAPARAGQDAVADENSSGLPAITMPVLAGLILVALFVFIVLPRLVGNSGPDTLVDPRSAESATPPAEQRSARDGEAGAPASAATPFADAVEARARAEAQELLGELIDVRENLSARGADSWAADAMAAIAAEATAGDERYRERAFSDAIERYRRALDLALALEGSLPERFAAQLEAVDAAVEALDAESAQAALDLAGQIEPGDPALEARAARVASLPTVIASADDAGAAEASGDLARAVTALEAAVAADGAHQWAAAELLRLRTALTEQRFSAAMSEGYAALDEGAFDRAQARFDRAAALKPGAAEAAAALQELSIARTAARLTSLQRRASTLAAEESWDEAITVYEEALAIDGSLRFAREGLAVARPRAALASALDAIIEEPGRLVDDAILREARATLARAEGIEAPGARLSQRIAETQDILRIASTPVPVQLRSDAMTEVTVYKVARLGLFESQRLELRPGEYTAVGRRRGFRDVRVVFTVTPGSSDAVYIACNETI